jgi:hypothetical protein
MSLILYPDSESYSEVSPDSRLIPQSYVRALPEYPEFLIRKP